jgi:multiple sugar transport system permease protein
MSTSTPENTLSKKEDPPNMAMPNNYKFEESVSAIRTRKFLQVLKNVGVYILIASTTLIFVFPYFWMVLTAFKLPQDIREIPPKILFTPTLMNFQDLIEKYQVLPAIRNSIIVVLMGTSLAVIFGMLASYALARFRFPGKNTVALDILSIRMVPPIASAIPIFLISLKTGLFNTYWVLALVNAVFNIPLVVWVLRVFIEELPLSIEESALVDGCSRLRILWSITLPLIAPGLIATTILAAIFIWNEFLFANILTGPETKTLPIVIALSIETRRVAWGIAAAGGTLISLPIVFPLMYIQRYLVRGLTFGVLKG